MNIIEELLSANRFYADHIDAASLHNAATGAQRPVAAVVACSDSRVPVEVIFNQLHPGRLFIIRVAGNIIAGPAVTGSIEYAVEHLHVPVLIILGHTDCGLLKAKIAGGGSGEVAKLCREIDVICDTVSEAVIENVQLQVQRVMALDSVTRAVWDEALNVYGMLYDLETGLVSVLSRNGAKLPGTD